MKSFTTPIIGKGSSISSQVALMMTRLSIIDINGGNQPLLNENKSIAVIGNGEIYNFIELREELKDKGHVFSTRTDIEAVVHAYEQWGKYFVKKLRGMFALAIHDKNNNRVLLIRDRIGEKPLLFEIEAEEAWDIDEELDFQIAEFLMQARTHI